jgi:hypothetical protein
MLGHIGRIAALAGLLMSGSASAQTLFLQDTARPVQAEAAGDASPELPVRLGPGLFDLEPGAALALSDIEGREHSVRLDRIEAHALGGRSWIGQIEGADGLRRVILTESQGVVFGSVDTPEGFYAIRPQAAGQPLVMAPSSLMGDGPSGQDFRYTNYPRPFLSSLAAPQATTPDRPAAGELGTIDIGMVYTEGMAAYYGIGLTARLQFLATVFDQALVDSESGVRANLAWIGPVGVPWDEDTSTLETLDDLFAGVSFGNPGTEPDVVGTCSDLDGVCENNGDLSALFDVREGLAVDLMIMLRRYRPSRQVYCGVAYLPNAPAEGDIDPVADRIYGVAVSGDGPDVDGSFRNCGEGGTVAHEFGHNLGAVHNAENSSIDGLFGYSYGHRVDCDFRTIMAYDSTRSGITNCPFNSPPSGPNERWVMVFSNPDINICPAGQACGTPANRLGTPGDDNITPTNVARSIREEGNQVQHYAGPAPRAVRSAILPHGRVAEAGGDPVTAFATIINPLASGGTATDCGLILHGASPGHFNFTATDPATNAVTGELNAKVDIPAGGAQSFVFSLYRPFLMPETELRIEAGCGNRRAATDLPGVNTFRLSAIGFSPTDIIALAATAGNTGSITLPSPTGTAAFAVATSNVGSAASVTVRPRAGDEAAALGAITVCETDPATGACVTARSAELVQPVSSGATHTYAVFVTGAGAASADPARNRVYLDFRSGSGLTLGSTSVAFRTAE